MTSIGRPGAQRTSSLAPLLTLCVLFAALTVPMALANRVGTSESVDQNKYHWPTIVAMSEHWPRIALDDYHTATGPAYHALLAAVVQLTGDNQTPIRVLNALLAIPVVLVMFLLARRHAGPWLSALLALPIALSAYVLSSAIWITTDNIALALLLFALYVATAPRGVTSSSGAAIAAAFATSVRQIHLWVVAPVALARFLHAIGPRREPAGHAALGAITITLPALLVVALLYWWWGGLTPPYVEARHAPVGNAFAFGFAMSLIGLFGVFCLPLSQPWKDRELLRGWTLFVVAVASLSLTLFTATTLDKDAGRWGGPIWALVEQLPAPFDRSIVFPPLAMLGGMFLLVASRRAASLGRTREALVALCAIICFTLAHAVQPWASQRYFEPFLLAVVLWLAALGVEPAAPKPDDVPPKSPPVWLGPLALALFQAGVSAFAVYWASRPADIP